MNFRALAIHTFVVAAALASAAVPAAAAAPIDAAATGPGAAINAIIGEYETDVRANTQKIIAATTEE